MILSDRSLLEEIKKGHLVVKPFDESCLQPASIDLRLANEFRVFKHINHALIDTKVQFSEYTELAKINDGDKFVLHPGEFVLGSTLEWVKVPDDLVGRIEGKSSLGRLGVIVHASITGDQEMLIQRKGECKLEKIQDVVKRKGAVKVASFDPQTLKTGWFKVTKFIENPTSHVFELTLESGRKTKLTASHNVFTLNEKGQVVSKPLFQYKKGELVAVPRRIPPVNSTPQFNLPKLLITAQKLHYMLRGTAVETIFEHEKPKIRQEAEKLGYNPAIIYSWNDDLKIPLGIVEKLNCGSYYSTEFISQTKAGISAIGSDDYIPGIIKLDNKLAWSLGLYVAEGSWRNKDICFTNNETEYIEKVKDTFGRYGVHITDSMSGKTHHCYICSKTISDLFAVWGLDKKAHEKRIPGFLLSATQSIIREFLKGYYAGDGTEKQTFRRGWSVSSGLANDIVYLETLLERKASLHAKQTKRRELYEIYSTANEHKLFEYTPNPNELIKQAREELQMNLTEFGKLNGWSKNFQWNLENKEYQGIRKSTLKKLVENLPAIEERKKLAKIVEGDINWDRIIEIKPLKNPEPTFDIEVYPGKSIQNFIGGTGGIFLHNTAGYVDPGFEGNLTLEINNVGKIPVALYPGMKIAQFSVMTMTTAAQNPYGSAKLNSKYQSQAGPTESMIHKNF